MAYSFLSATTKFIDKFLADRLLACLFQRFIYNIIEDAGTALSGRIKPITLTDRFLSVSFDDLPPDLLARSNLLSDLFKSYVIAIAGDLLFGPFLIPKRHFKVIGLKNGIPLLSKIRHRTFALQTKKIFIVLDQFTFFIRFQQVVH